MKIKLPLILLFCLLHSAVSLAAQGTAVADSLQNRVLPPALQLDKETFEDFNSDKFYQYVDEKTLWERFIRWLFRNPKEASTGFVFIKYILTAIGILVFLVVLYLILRYNTNIFTRDRQLASYTGPGDIAADNDEFDRRIHKALEAGNFAEATRWLFLKTLKNLHERSLISFDSRKTVHEYVYEIADMQLRHPFSDLARHFAYYHYGQAAVDEQMYRQFSQANDDLLNRLPHDQKK